MYRLKQTVPEFTVVDGEYTGHGYKRGRVYNEVPPEHRDRFEAMGETPQEPPPPEPEIDPEPEIEHNTKRRIRHG